MSTKSEPSTIPPHSSLPTQYNYTTTHDPSTGTSIFLSTALPISESLTFKPIHSTISQFADLHETRSVPVSLADDVSDTTNATHSNQNPAYVPAAGASFRRTDMPPGAVSPMHRTLTLDYGIVVAGAVELILEGGETRVLRVGDTVVQRGTMHRWKNVGAEGEWCRMVWVQMPLVETEIAGHVLKEEYRRP